jgi:beta-galactosidase
MTIKKSFRVAMILAAAIVVAAAAARAAADAPQINDVPTRQVLSLNAGWSYLEDNCADPAAVSQSTVAWKRVDLPHTWNVWDAVDALPGYRRSASWYKKDLMIPRCANDLRFILSFEGVSISSDVYVNGLRAGGHAGGYVGFDIDITPYVRQGEENTIMVRATNEYNPDIIPSQKSDFCICGGITRNVWLKVVPSVYIKALKIRTPLVKKAFAVVEAEVTVTNATAHEKMIALTMSLIDRAGNEISHQSLQKKLAPGESLGKFPEATITTPELWSPADPALYTVKIQVRQSSEIVDDISDRFGCRYFEIKEHGPFYLNGERLLLRGTHRHEDYAGYGNALPDSLQRKDMKMIKEMGANFVRLAHYPQAPEVYRACDELGILVWDELPWCRGGMGGEPWKSNTKRLLKEQIEQNFNHPSIIFHSLGNELNWLPDFPGGDNLDSLRAMISELNRIAHALDPSRLTSTRKFTEAADCVDVVSPSIWPGWYSGNYKGFEKAITDAKDKFAHLVHVEYGGDSHVGRHTENPVTGDATTVPDGFEENIKPQKVKNVAANSDWSENYIVDLFDWDLHVSEQLEFLTGNAQWAFKDFPTPLRPENPIPYINQKGLVDRAGNPKDAYYVFKSYWTTSPLFCYIESHTWTERSGPANVKREVNVFSNCAEVELFLNGVSQGRHTRNIKNVPAAGLSWQVNFAEGRNSLLAIGYKDGKTAATDSIAVGYSFRKIDVADHLVVSSEKMPNGNQLITAVAADKDGQRCLDYNKRVYFTWDGAGRLLENFGTPTKSSIIEMANGRAQIEFEPAPKGRAVIEVRNQDFKGEYVIVGK